MSVKIEITPESYPMPECPSTDEVLSARIRQQEAILNALAIETEKATEKMNLLKSIINEASRTRQAGLQPKAKGPR